MIMARGPQSGRTLVKIGISMFVTDYSMKPQDLAAAVEERGFESLWLPEHTHIPTSRASPWGGGPELPRHYKETLDPFLALTAAAMATKRIKLATGICLIVERDPIHTAKEVATLDYLSGGRVILGVGGGWNREEMANHGTAFETRFQLMRERIEAIKTIWTNDVAEYRSKHVTIDPMWCWPKPVQKPHPPIILGGGFPQGAKRAIAFGDGWMPIGDRELDPLDVRPRYRQMIAEAGRDPDTMPMSIFTGSRGQGLGADERARLKKYRDAGVERTVLLVPTAGPETTLPLLDTLAGLIEN
jgi:probable F420-dependent oxidoreductase